MSGLSASSKALLIIGTALAVLPIQAEEFSWQLSGVTSRTEVGSFDRDGWAVDGTYYVNPLDDGDGPYALASFLNPTTRVSALASRSNSRFDDPTAYTLGGTYVLPGQRWYVGADYAKTDARDGALNVTRNDEKGYGVLAGRYLGANTTLELRLDRSVRSVETTQSCPPGAPLCLSGSYDSESTTDSVGLDVFHVRQFRSLTYSLRGGVSDIQSKLEQRSPLTAFVPFTSDGPSGRVYSVAGELFPTDRLGVRLGYSRPDGGAMDADTYNVTTTWFFKPRIAVELSLSRTHWDDIPNDFADADTAAIRFIGRL
jgi:putative general porin